jgi:hypothetical protein
MFWARLGDYPERDSLAQATVTLLTNIRLGFLETNTLAYFVAWKEKSFVEL